MAKTYIVYDALPDGRRNKREFTRQRDAIAEYRRRQKEDRGNLVGLHLRVEIDGIDQGEAWIDGRHIDYSGPLD